MKRFLYGLTISLFFMACVPDIPKEEFKPTEEETIESIEVPEGFDFNMIKEVDLTIQVPDSAGFARKDIPLYIYTDDPAKGGSLLVKGLTNEYGIYQSKFEVPPHQKTLSGFTTYPFIEYSQLIDITGSSIQFDWGGAPEVDSTNAFDYLFSAQNAGTPETFDCVLELLKNQSFENPSDFTIAKQKWGSPPIQAAAFDEVDVQGWLTTASDGRIELWKSTFGGVESFHGNQHAEINANQEASLYQDVPTTPGQVLLWRFAHRGRGGDDVISLFIGVPGSESLVTTETTGVSGWSEYYGVYTVPVGQVLTRFRWEAVSTASGNNSIGNFLDGISFGIACDTDQDGVLDIYDEDPGDPDVTVSPTSYTPGQTTNGTYAFEDLWPRRGDYDFNDLVLGYNYAYLENGQGQVTRIVCNFEIKGIGASMRNGFGVSFDNLSNNAISSVSGTYTTTINTLPNGCEAGHSNAVVIMFDHGHSLLGVGNGKLVNTDPLGASAPPFSFSVTIDLANPVAESQIGTINPFIFTGGDRSHEIHLMNHQPTALANTSLYGSDDDNTNPSNGRFYIDSKGFPWALNFPSTFNYPKERTNILQAYPIFRSWVSSGGTANTDWYNVGNAVGSRVIVQ